MTFFNINKTKSTSSSTTFPHVHDCFFLSFFACIPHTFTPAAYRYRQNMCEEKQHRRKRASPTQSLSAHTLNVLYRFLCLFPQKKFSFINIKEIWRVLRLLVGEMFHFLAW